MTKKFKFIGFDPNESEHRISHSQLHTWQDCEKRWEFSQVHALSPKREADYFTLGKMIHEWIGEYYRAIAAGFPIGGEATAQHIIDLMGSDIANQELDYEDPKMVEVNLRASQVVLRYIRDFSPKVDRGIKVIGVEEEISVPIITPKGRKIILFMIIDLLLEQDRRRWVLDHKTSGQPGFWTENEIMMDTQLPTYIGGINALGGNYFGGMLNFMNTYPYKDFWGTPLEKIFKRAKTYRTQKELDFSMMHYGTAADAMLDRVESKGEFVRKMSKDCARCPYMDLCLLDMKGIDSTLQQSELYVRRTDRVAKSGTSVEFSPSLT